MIRQARHGDIPALAGLWARAFQGERSVDQRIAQLESGGLFGGMETAWLEELDGQVAGAYRGYAMQQHMHGAVVPMMGLAAVAVDEAFRRRGIGRHLCQHAIAMARERGDVYSVLYPFRPAFYESLGWGLTGSLHSYRFRPESLRPSRAGSRSRDARGGSGDARGGSAPAQLGHGVRRAQHADLAGISACYDRFAAEANGPIRRSKRVWQLHLEGDDVHTYVLGDAVVRGYVIVRFGQSASPDEKPLYVRELVADDHHAYEALLAWLAAQQDTWRIILYEASPDERFGHRLMEPRAPGFAVVRNAWAPVARLIRGPMLRIIDVVSALESRRTWGRAAPLRFGLEVRDAQVPGNDGSFIVDFDGAGVRVTRGSAAPGLRLPVTALAQVLAGELRVTEALMLGLAEADGDVTTIDLAMRVERCFRLLDEF